MASKKRYPKEGTAAISVVPKRRRVPVKAGQLVAVPLRDGTFALVHVAVRYYMDIVCVLFDYRSRSVQELGRSLEAIPPAPIAAMQVTSNRIRDGLWPVLGVREPDYPPAMLDTRGCSSTASMTEALFEAYYGLVPWDEMADPGYWEKALLPGVVVPPTIRYKRDFEKDAAAASASPPAAASDAAEPPITDGPAVIHIEMKYSGEELPSVDLLHRRQALERALEEAGAGEVTGAGGGGGIMDIYLSTGDVGRSMPLVQVAVDASSFANDATIETLPATAAADDED